MAARDTGEMSESLATYLNDHLGGATTGVALARRLAESSRGEPEHELLDELARRIEEDLETLRTALHAIGDSGGALKQAAGWVAEKVHELGTFVDAGSSDPHLARLLETESLSLGVEGKRCMWVALMEVSDEYPALAALDLPRLVDRAREQRRVIEALRKAAARRAFTNGRSFPPGPGPSPGE